MTKERKGTDLIVAAHGQSPPYGPLQNVGTCESREEVPETEERCDKAFQKKKRVLSLLGYERPSSGPLLSDGGRGGEGHPGSR